MVSSGLPTEEAVDDLNAGILGMFTAASLRTADSDMIPIGGKPITRM